MKLYKIEFMRYTNCMKDTVSTWMPSISDNTKHEYINVGKEAFIVTEDQLKEIKKYGGGIRNCIFVGNLWEPDNPYTIKN